jgi:hypothetical protein
MSGSGFSIIVYLVFVFFVCRHHLFLYSLISSYLSLVCGNCVFHFVQGPCRQICLMWDWLEFLLSVCQLHHFTPCCKEGVMLSALCASLQNVGLSASHPAAFAHLKKYTLWRFITVFSLKLLFSLCQEQYIVMATAAGLEVSWWFCCCYKE